MLFHTQSPRRFGVNVRFDVVGDGKPFMVSRFLGIWLLFCCEVLRVPCDVDEDASILDKLEEDARSLIKVIKEKRNARTRELPVAN